MREMEYKTVAMPQLVTGRRRRRQTRAEMIAETMSSVINKQAEAGWSYLRADTFQTFERKSWFHPREIATYTVLVFARPAAQSEAEKPVLIKRPRQIATPKPKPTPTAPVVEAPAAPVDPRPEPRVEDAAFEAPEAQEPVIETPTAKPAEAPAPAAERAPKATRGPKEIARDLAQAAALAAKRGGAPLFKSGGGEKSVGLTAKAAAERLFRRAAETEEDGTVVRRPRR